MKVILPEHIRASLRQLDKDTRRLLGVEIRKFQSGQYVNFKKLHYGKDKWRIAAGDWRIMLVSSVENNEKTYTVIDIIARKDAYR